MYEQASMWSSGGGGGGGGGREKIGERERVNLVDFVLLPPIRPLANTL